MSGTPFLLPAMLRVLLGLPLILLSLSPAPHAAAAANDNAAQAKVHVWAQAPCIVYIPAPPYAPVQPVPASFIGLSHEVRPRVATLLVKAPTWSVASSSPAQRIRPLLLSTCAYMSSVPHASSLPIPPSLPFLGLPPPPLQPLTAAAPMLNSPVYRRLLSLLSSHDTGPLVIRWGGSRQDDLNNTLGQEHWWAMAEVHRQLGVKYAIGLNLMVRGVSFTVLGGGAHEGAHDLHAKGWRCGRIGCSLECGHGRGVGGSEWIGPQSRPTTHHVPSLSSLALLQKCTDRKGSAVV